MRKNKTGKGWSERGYQLMARQELVKGNMCFHQSNREGS